MASLGRMERVDVRQVWESEPGGFTPWLAQEGNLRLLGDTIGIELELEAQERSVGPFRADILCKDTATGAWVLVENQLEQTDHTHLGQLLTYAAGLHAVTVVWISQRFTDEHRATLDWLNEITDESFNFFGLEIELWRIGASAIAPKFNIVSKPNDWSRTIRRLPPGLTETKQLQLEYWTQFRDFLAGRNSPVRPTKPFPQHWMNFAIGRSGCLLFATVNTRELRIGCGLAITDRANAKAYYRLLEVEKSRIEEEAGTPLEWRELPEKVQSYVELFRQGVNPADREQWSDQHAWLAEKLEMFHRVFGSRVKMLRAETADEAEAPVGQDNPGGAGAPDGAD